MSGSCAKTRQREGHNLGGFHQGVVDHWDRDHGGGIPRQDRGRPAQGRVVAPEVAVPLTE